MIRDKDLVCSKGCGMQPHRYRPYHEAGPYWRCSECGSQHVNGLLDDIAYLDLESAIIRDIWVDGPDSEARRAARTPDPTHTPAVLSGRHWWSTSNDEDIHFSPEEAYEEEAEMRMRDCLDRRDVDYWDWREETEDEHVKRVVGRWASLIRHRDEKAGYR